MKKKIIIIVSIIVVLALAVGGAYLIDKNRMDNNKPVIFSTWGAKYAPPAEIIAPPKLYMKLENNDDRIEAITGTYSWTKIVNGVGQGINSDSVHPSEMEFKNTNTIFFNNSKILFENKDMKISAVNLYKINNTEKLDKVIHFSNKTIGINNLGAGEYALEILAEYPEGKVCYAVKLIVNEDGVNTNNVVTVMYNSAQNINRLFEFVENTKADSLNRIEDEIRVITYTIEGDPIIKDIKFVMNDEESFYEIITDTTQDKFGVPQVITKKYDASLYTVTVKNEGNYNEACLTALSETSEEIEDISICPIYYMIEENSFIATIIEEEPTYLIVEPNDGELEKLQSKTRKILIAGGEYRDYIYGVGRKVIITYDNKIQSDTNTIIGADIDTDGYEKFEFEVVESEKLEKRKILNNTDLHKLNTSYDLYYYGLEEVSVKVDNKVMTLENALKDGYLTMSGILSKANRDIRNKKISDEYYEIDYIYKDGHLYPYEVRYEDGGSVEFHYANVVIIKFNTLDGNNSMYICKAGTTLNDLK